jgi:hypothetical protein
MRRYVTAVTLCLTLGAIGAMPANAAPDRTYVKYAQVRDKVKACALDGQSRALGTERRKQCSKLRKRYTLYGRFGIPGTTFIRCKTRKHCPKAPIGVPNPRGPIPARSVRIYG